MEVKNMELGVSAAFLRAFRAEHNLAGLTTEQVKQQIVLEESKEWECVYIKVPKVYSNKHYLGEATVFVSHAWKYDMNDVIDVLLRFADQQHDGKEIFFWFDVFCVNQHTHENHTSDWWQTAFKKQIKDIGKVLLVMAPWQDPIPMTRAWCLWEIHCAIEGKIPLSIGLPPNQRDAFQQGVTESFDAITKALVRIDATKSTAFLSADRDKIHAAIKATEGGFHGLNVQVKNHLRQWYLDTALELAEQMQDGQRTLTLMNIAASLSKLGDNANALLCYQRCLATLGERHSEIPSIYNNMTNIHISMGNYRLARETCKKSLQIKIATLGEGHLDIASSHNNLGNIERNTGNHAEALEAYQRALQIRLAKLGERHPETVGTMYSIANTQLNMGNHAKAFAMFENTLRISLGSQGEHPDTAGSYMGLANAYSSMGSYAKALKLYERSLNIRMATLGEQHPDTAITIGNIGTTLIQARQVAEGRDKLQRSVYLLTRAVGAGHPNTQTFAHVLARANALLQSGR
eukprot:m.14785 g.14785  ORF g.14785 m.14785 type:complete len:518 (+) comp7228_c0_seq1:82-1635(+)